MFLFILRQTFISEVALLLTTFPLQRLYLLHRQYFLGLSPAAAKAGEAACALSARKRQHSASALHTEVALCVQCNWSLYLHQSAKLAFVVFQKEPTLVVSDQSVVAGD